MYIQSEKSSGYRFVFGIVAEYKFLDRGISLARWKRCAYLKSKYIFDYRLFYRSCGGSQSAPLATPIPIRIGNQAWRGCGS
jgi:hypothetical protein